jgi:hypothetical protein
MNSSSDNKKHLGLFFTFAFGGEKEILFEEKECTQAMPIHNL